MSGAGCGQIKLGEAPITNEPAPAGKIVAQGTFQPENGQTVQGNAVIYLRDSDHTIVVRIEGVVFPVETGLKLNAKADGAIAATFSLRSSTGSQNYNTPIGDGHTWNSVILHSSQKNLDYASAPLR